MHVWGNKKQYNSGFFGGFFVWGGEGVGGGGEGEGRSCAHRAYNIMNMDTQWKPLCHDLEWVLK